MCKWADTRPRNLRSIHAWPAEFGTLKSEQRPASIAIHRLLRQEWSSHRDPRLWDRQRQAAKGMRNSKLCQARNHRRGFRPPATSINIGRTGRICELVATSSESPFASRSSAYAEVTFCHSKVAQIRGW